MINLRASHLLWDDLRYLLVVARAGSANRAADEIGADHSTVSRRLRNLEGRLGVSLFKRLPGANLVLTTEGKIALEEVLKMEQASDALLRKLSGTDCELAGKVRLAANDGVSTYWLMPALAPFLQAHPGINIEWIATNRTRVEVGRDADLVLQWYRPTAPDLVVRRIGTAKGYLHMDPRHVRQEGVPKSIDELCRYPLLDFCFYETIPSLKPWNDLIRASHYPKSQTTVKKR